MSNKKYLFRYPIGDFATKFRNKDNNILSIFLKDNLNHIQIIVYQNVEYIFAYELDFCEFCNVDSDSYYRKKRRKMFDYDEDDYDNDNEDLIVKFFDERFHESNYKTQIYYE